MAFFLFEAIAASWPRDLSTDEAKSISLPGVTSSLRDLAVAARADFHPLRLQSALLARQAMGVSDEDECGILYCWVAFNQLDYRSFDAALNALRERNPSRLEVRVLTLLGWLWIDDVHSIASAPSEIWLGEEYSPLLQLCKADFLIKLGKLAEAESILSGFGDCICPEMAILQASVIASKENKQSAIDFLLSKLHRCPDNIRFYRELLNHMIEGKDAVNVMSCARDALSKFGEHPSILYHCTTLNLFKRQPGLAKRSALLQQISASVRPTSINFCNQLATYEMNGQANWMNFLSSRIAGERFFVEPLLQANLVMQFASIQSDKYESHVKGLVDSIEAENGFLQICKKPEDFSNKNEKYDGEPSLNIGWMTGDCNYHPVTRFLYGWFASRTNVLRHKHTLVNLEDHREKSYCDLIRATSCIDVHDVSRFQGVNRMHEIRQSKYDVVVDLSGWTGGNFIAGLIARLAPVQVNYLGYFASSGLASMDYWLGDAQLFSSENLEWSSESLFRLPRPFLAWTPMNPLPEAGVSVSMAPSGPVRFGSFNHNRKLTDATLRLWAKLLGAVPGSRLVLKASAQTDSDTQRLLRRRMLRQGLDPERVDWLDLTSGAVEHMQQYSHIDIALDPIPNGGCTTTCEALWMGVPTITLSGTHYVSRMSTAVLSGANMNEWIAQDQTDYINLALEQAARVTELRQNREHWRRQVQDSPLGDASDLMYHLEKAFSQMHAQIFSGV